ncbi:flippase [Runella salmonicolor]|uniref:Flippase n=1 Tax=Runella salmonicolor TaxID=2950278 RepID=A0ABT1FRN6_9BACT|nr:flippase [Runella salmonicolor]MCP1384371.1 flippase [Runella salmonicolor]
MSIITQIISFSKTNIAANTFYLLIDKISKLGNFIVILLIAQNYGIKTFGDFSFAFAFVSILGSFSELGIKNIVIRYLVQNKNKRDIYLGTSSSLIFCASLLCLLLSITYISTSDDTALIKTLILFFSLPYAFRPFYVIFYYFESKSQVKVIVPYLFLNTLVCLILKLFLILNKLNILTFGYITFVEGVIEVLILLFIFQKKGYSIRKWSFDWSIFKLFIKESMPIFISGVMIMIYIKIDQILLQKLSTSHESGLYALAAKLLEITFIVPTILTASYLPSIIKSIFLKDTSILMNLYKIYRNISLFIIVTTFLFADFFINIFYGSSYNHSIILLKIMIPTVLFVSISSIANSYIQIIGKSYIQMLISILVCLLNITLNFLLIPIHQAKGAAIATLLSYTSYVLLIMLFLPRQDINKLYILKALTFSK